MHLPTNEDPKPSNSSPNGHSDADRLAARLAKLSPSQRDLLEQRLAQRPTAGPTANAANPDSDDRAPDASIAIVGIGCRFPGAGSPDAFWRLIESGLEAVGPVPGDRWARDQFFDPTGRAPGKMSVDAIGAISEVDHFDPNFFGISPREASRMDPQQRLLLEVAWETFEDAGIPVDAMAGTNTGVFIGIGGTDYSKVPARYPDYFQQIDAHMGTGNALSIAAGRISYLFDLHGPAFIVDTACSSASVAIHSAAVALLRGECDAALAGGVNLILSPETTIAFSKARMLSPDGHCRPFDDSANGYVRGEGCGLVLLKRLSDAQRDGDEIVGLLRGSAVNQDGRTSGITAPSGEAQTRVVRAAMAAAGVNENDITYIEAHGTGTPLGDPIELMALAETFARRNTELPPVRIGSVKANIGHTETVSGVAGLIKVLLMFRYGRIPRQVNFRRLNSNIQLPTTKLEIATTNESWQPTGNGRFIAGVSSFGFGGTNAHLIVEKFSAQHDTPEPTEPLDTPQHACLPISVRAAGAAHELARRYHALLQDASFSRALAVCRGAATTRSALPIRHVALGGSVAQLQDSLESIRSGVASPGVVSGMRPTGRRTRTAMLFSGQGSQYVGMAQGLWTNVPVFKSAIDQCADILDPVLGLSLIDVLSQQVPGHDLSHTALAQPAICAVQCALVDAYRQLGIRPDVVAGHSIGEIAALYAANALTKTQALLLAAYRGQVMGQLPAGGSMAAILAEEEVVKTLLSGADAAVVIAASNGPGSTVIAGDTSSVNQVLQYAAAENLVARPLVVSHAFHSPQMEAAMGPLREKLATLFDRIEIPRSVSFVSALTGKPHTGPIDLQYWLDHLVRPVRFTDVINAISQMQVDVAIEIGPRPQLASMFRAAAGHNTASPFPDVAPALDPQRDDQACWLRSIATAWCAGVNIDWKYLDRRAPKASGSRVLGLPHYPFQRERYWHDPPGPGSVGSGTSVHPLLGVRQALAAGGVIYSRVFRDNDPGYFGDHVVSGSVTIPAAAWIEAACAAAADVFGGSPLELREFEITRPLFLEPGRPVLVQFSIQSPRMGRCHIRIDSKSSDDSWQTHVTALAVKSKQSSESTDELSVLPTLKAPLASAIPIDTSNLYQRLGQSGLAYGEFFQVLSDVTTDGSTATATLELLPAMADGAQQYRLHPTLLDGALQLIAVVVPAAANTASSSPRTYLPVGLGQLTFGDATEIKHAIVHRLETGVDSPSADEILADVELLDDRYHLVAKLARVRLKSLTHDSSPTLDPNQWLYQVEWSPLAEQGDLDRPTFENTDHCLRHVGSQRFQSLIAPPLDVDSSQQVAEHWVWTPPLPETSDLASATLAATGDFLETIQAALRCQPSPRVSIITQHGVQVDASDVTCDCIATAVIGMARVAANEHPQLQIRMLDVDDVDDVGVVTAWLDSQQNETELAVRGGRYFQTRLVARPRLLLANTADAELPLPRQGSYRVRLDGTHRMEGLWTQRIIPPTVGSGEVAVEIKAVGLNFSDVLKSMGLYPGITDAVVPMGIEISGRVTAAGEDVTGLQIGSRVMGIVPYGFATDDATNDYLLMPVPERMSDEEAASVPIVFLTAHHALLHVGHLTAEEAVLIHAGAGGVGLAAIQVAKSVGATIFATAGSDSKRRLLAALGVHPQHIFDSRDIDSIEGIRARTNGRGVDVVLNSLPGEWIERSLELLAAHGRFLEIGKVDIYQNRAIGLLPFQDNLSYSAIDLDRFLRQRPAAVKRLFAEVTAGFASGDYHPLPITSFRLRELPHALRFMAARRNIGKVVVTPPPKRADGVVPAGVYLISGGSGAIAQGIAKRLIQRGAKAVALIGRRAVPKTVQTLTAWAAQHDATIEYLQSDCADESSFKAPLEQLRLRHGPISGVIHAAGLLDDALIHELSLDSLRGVLHPKVAGAIALDRLTANDPLQSFTLVGSIAAVFGSPGQANYAAANAFLEGFARDRRHRGLPANVVHWGPWASAGMAEDPTRLRNLTAKGLRPLDFANAIDLLIDTAVAAGRRTEKGSESDDVVAVDVQWKRMLGAVSASAVPSVLRSQLDIDDVSSSQASNQNRDDAFRQEIMLLDEQSRTERLTDYFAQHLGRIMSMDPAAMDPLQPLGALGLDSLMAIELKNTIEAKLAITIPISRFVDNPTLASLAVSAAETLQQQPPREEVSSVIGPPAGLKARA